MIALVDGLLARAVREGAINKNNRNASSTKDAMVTLFGRLNVDASAFFCPRTTRYTTTGFAPWDLHYIERLTMGFTIERYTRIYNGNYHGGFARYLVRY